MKDCFGNYSLCGDCIKCGKSTECITRMNHPKVTNADFIRNMSDEELAEIIVNYDSYVNEVPFCTSKEECDEKLDNKDLEIDEEDCKKCALEWLQSEVE